MLLGSLEGTAYTTIQKTNSRKAIKHSIIRPAKTNSVLQPLCWQVRAALTPTSASAVDVQFLEFRVGPVKIKAPETAKGALDTTYLDEDLRVSRGDKGNLFVLMKAVGQEPDFS